MDMNELSLKQLMDPKRLDLQARYQNAQIAIDRSYDIAKRYANPPEVRIPNPLWKEGDPSYDKTAYVDPTDEQKAQSIVKLARMLRVDIENDLNETLKILEPLSKVEESNGAKASTSHLS